MKGCDKYMKGYDQYINGYDKYMKGYMTNVWKAMTNNIIIWRAIGSDSYNYSPTWRWFKLTIIHRSGGE